MQKPIEHTAAFFETLKDGKVECGLCPHHCKIAPGKWGVCRTRTNEGGVLKVVSYGNIVAAALDPIEKKPLFHYRPGSSTFSIASAGCNLRCPFCQNHHISQSSEEIHLDPSRNATPKTIVEMANQRGAQSISFTYSEPILMFEFAQDTFEIAGASELDLVFVTNGQASKQAAEESGQFIRAANVDIKCFSEASYRDVLKGSLSHTLSTIEAWKAASVWVEITTLVIPGFNDGDKELRDIARFIKSVDESMPWHISRFHPNYEWLDRAVTPQNRIQTAREIGLAEGLRFVYTGNMPSGAGETTCCPSCDAKVIEREGFLVTRTSLKNGCCEKCGEQIAGVGLP
jgi:pyruvate formate lyase activating enzyme